MSTTDIEYDQDMVDQAKKRGFNVYIKDGKVVTVAVKKGVSSSKKPIALPLDHVMKSMFDYQPPEDPAKFTGERKELVEKDPYYRTLVTSKYEKELAKALKQNPHDIALRRYTDEMPFTEAAMIHAGRETDKLGAGLADIADIARGMAGEDIQKNLARRDARAAEQRGKDREFTPFDEETNASGLAAMLPYTVTGTLSKPFTSAAGRVINLAGKGVEKGAVTTAKATAKESIRLHDLIAKGYKDVSKKLPKSVDKGIRSGTQKFKDKVNREIVTPIREIGETMSNRKPIVNPFRGRPVPEFAGATALGALEGAAHYDENIIDGAISSQLGWTGGKLAKNKLSRSPNLNSDPRNANIKRWKKDLGYRPLPGEQTGLRELQKITSDTRTSPGYASSIRIVEDANSDAIARHALNATGLDYDATRGVTPEKLSEHIKNQRSIFEALEAETYGQPPEGRRLDLIEGLFENYDEPTQKKLYGIIKDIEYGFDGKEYKNLYKRVKDAYNNARMNNLDVQESYKDILDVMDDSITRGMKSKIGGEELVNRWKKARENFAMTKLLLNHGMDPEGHVSPKKLTGYLMETDPERLLTGTGGAIQNLHDIARLSNMKKDQAGGGIGNYHVDGVAPDTYKPGLMTTPNVGSPNIYRQARFEAFRRGYPGETGLLGLKREGPFNAENLFRAEQQGTDFTRDIKDKYDLYERKAANLMRRGLFDLTYDEDEEENRPFLY